MTSQNPSARFLEVSFSNLPEGFAEILTAELAEIGFDSFSEEEDLFLSYIPEAVFDEMAVHQVLQKYPPLKDVLWSMIQMPEKNWNEIWESNYEPVLIAGKCYIRAPFHKPFSEPGQEENRQGTEPGAQSTAHRHPASTSTVPSPHGEEDKSPSGDLGVIELVIEPKMSFGTAHHETTSLMVEVLLEETLEGKEVLDMGCGTGILAILASKRGAKRVLAIDFDEWAVENSRENAERNNTPHIDVIQGEASVIPDDPFDVILANINKNTLLEQMQAYADALKESGILVLSGFYSEDLPVLETRASELGLILVESRNKNNWIVAKFKR